MRKVDVPCDCGATLQTKVYPDGWYVLIHTTTYGKIKHWKCGWYK